MTQSSASSTQSATLDDVATRTSSATRTHSASSVNPAISMDPATLLFSDLDVELADARDEELLGLRVEVVVQHRELEKLAK